jgi:hypothetical protein
MENTWNSFLTSKPAFIARLYFFAWFFVLFLYSCDNPDLTNFDTPLTLGRYDTVIMNLPLIVKSVPVDSIITNGLTTDLIGSYYDTTVGSVKASVFAEFGLPYHNFDFGTSPKLDSVVLSMKYAGSTAYFGNLNQMMYLEVFELSNRIHIDSSYYSTTNIPFYPTKIGTWIGYPQPSSSTLRIKLSNDFGNKLLSATSTQLSTDDAFAEFFKGIAIVPKSQLPYINSQGSIVDFYLQDSRSTITIYYKNDADTSSISLSVTDISARFSKYEHDFSGSFAKKQFDNKDKEFPILVLQPLGGVKLSIDIPDLKKLVDSSMIAIHRAEIIFTVDLNSPYIANIPTSLILLKSDSAGKISSIVDRLESHYGGTYNTYKKYYSFGITRHIQDLLMSYSKDPYFKELYKLNLIIPSDNPVTSSPLLINNKDVNGNSLIKLKLIYSKI